MPDEDLPTLPGDWERRLTNEVVAPLEAGRVASIATSAAAVAGAGGVAVATITAATVAKVTTAVLATVTVAGGIAAAVGILPDPLQSWVADLVDGIGIQLPRPEEVLPILPTVTVPEVTVPVITVPVVTLPSVPLP